MADGSQFSTEDVASRLGVDEQAVEDYVASRLLRVSSQHGGQRLIDGESVESLATALALPEGPERSDAMASLRERNVPPPDNPFI